ncbi:MAG: AI-2E family transporter [Terrimicrobiaceae bacterium]
MGNGLDNASGIRRLRGLQAAGWMVVIAISFVLIRAGKDLFIPLVIALIGVYLIKVLERWIGYVKVAGRGLPPFAALALAFVAVIALSFLLFSIIADNAMRVAEFAPRYQIRLLALQADLFLAIGFEQPPAIREFLGGFDIPGTLALVATNLATLLKNAVLILIFAVFLLLESQFIPAKIAAIFPGEERRVLVQGILKRVDRDIQTYFGVKTAVSLVTAVLSYGVMKFVELDFAAFWALLVFILNFIPTIGSIFATALPGLLALVQFEEWRPVVILVVGITIIQQFLGNIVEPNLMGITLNLSPLVVVMSLIVWGMLWGVVGMFLCVPITVILVIILANFPGTSWVAILLSKDGTVRL